MSDRFVIAALTSTQSKALVTGVAIIVLAAARWLVLRAVRKRFTEEWVGYRARKSATYATTIVGLIVVAWIWIDAFNDLPTFLGLVSAGIAIALADVLKNLAGWSYILSRRPFRVGDRIEVDGSRGDVVDIRLFRFSLMEVGNWVDADQSTGRLIHVPNGIVFTQSVANYTEGFEHIWYEVPVLVTFESDRTRTRALIEEAVRKHAPRVGSSVDRNIRETAQRYNIKVGALTPIVYLSVRDSGVLFTARFLLPTRKQRDIDQAIWTSILDAIDDEPNVDLAYPTVRTYLSGPITVDRDRTDGEGRG
jgi:small-conductance mechanosensitive channel